MSQSNEAVKQRLEAELLRVNKQLEEVNRKLAELVKTEDSDEDNEDLADLKSRKMVFASQQLELAKKLEGLSQQVSAKPAESTAQNPIWKKIVEEYMKLGAPPKREVGEDGSLAFKNRQDAEKFFDTQANDGRPFLVAERKDGKPTDQHMMSVGDGECYKGTPQEIYKQLQEANKKNPNDGSNNQLRLKGMEDLKSVFPKAKLGQDAAATRELVAMADTATPERSIAPAPGSGAQGAGLLSTERASSEASRRREDELSTIPKRGGSGG